MKTALFAVALGAFVAVRASEEGSGVDEARALFEDAAKINWEQFSPGALGMKLNFDELGKEELDKVVSGFIQLGLIEEAERESFAESLTHPAMRYMLENVKENWSETMAKILKDPAFSQFLKRLKGGVDDAALGSIVGIEGGISGAVKRLQEEAEEQEEEEQEEEDAEEGEQQSSK